MASSVLHIVRGIARPRWLVPLWFGAALFLNSSASVARADVEAQGGVFITRQLMFWDKIFTKYKTTTNVIHDAYFPNMVIDVIDSSLINVRVPRSRRRQLSDLTDRYLERYRVALKRFHQYGSRATSYGPIEGRVFAVYKRDPVALAALYKGRVAIRSQGGLADEFAAAVERAKPYLPHMEKIFRAHGLPVELTRIPFVESMFNPSARSKVGASGIWQFMPGTARQFMYVNHYLDERNSPLKATHAAAKLLRLNYQELKSWPLAITAYNHGRSGMERAVRVLGTRNVNTVIQRYASDSFGFASRNFYSEFLAARNVFRRLYIDKVDGKSNLLTNVETIRIKKRVSIAALTKNSPIDDQTLKILNPCLLPSAFARYKNSPLPAEYELIVPKHIAPKIKFAISQSRATAY